MALVHDLAESIVGDYTPKCDITPEEKHRLERDAMVNISDMIGKNGEHIYQLFLVRNVGPFNANCDRD